MEVTFIMRAPNAWCVHEAKPESDEDDDGGAHVGTLEQKGALKWELHHAHGKQDIDADTSSSAFDAVRTFFKDKNACDVGRSEDDHSIDSDTFEKFLMAITTNLTVLASRVSHTEVLIRMMARSLADICVGCARPGAEARLRELVIGTFDDSMKEFMEMKNQKPRDAMESLKEKILSAIRGGETGGMVVEMVSPEELQKIQEQGGLLSIPKEELEEAAEAAAAAADKEAKDSSGGKVH